MTAKYSGSNFAPDEYINHNLDFDYDAKRDRWNGYDTMEHSKVIEEYQKVDEVSIFQCTTVESLPFHPTTQKNSFYHHETNCVAFSQCM